MSELRIPSQVVIDTNGKNKPFGRGPILTKNPSSFLVSSLEKELLNILQKDGEVTKAALLDTLPYSRSKINGGIASLIEKRYIRSNGSGEYTGGRRSVKFSINGATGFVAGVDIGATSLDLVIADMSKRIIARSSETANVREGPKIVLNRVLELLSKLLDENNLQREHLYSIGIGVPGPVDFDQGMVISPPIMPGWDGFPIIQMVQSVFPSAVAVVDNDVNVMALGESFSGSGKGVHDLIFVKIGTGIGAGIICNDSIYRGNNGCAGDIGHVSVKFDGPMCHCGNTGCLEAMAAGPAIAERGLNAALEGRSSILLKYYKANDRRIRAEDVGLAAAEGDPVSIEIIRSCGHMVGGVLASLVNFFNPGMIVIGGGVSNIGNLLLSSIRQVVLHRSPPLATRDLQIVFSSIGSDAGITGAIALAVDNIFQVDQAVDV